MKKTLKTILFYVLSCTWGIILTFIGVLIAAALLIVGYKPYKFHNYVYFRVGDHWGGFEMGPFFLLDNQCGLPSKQHEAGHGIQNAILGPFMPFVVSIPSATRWGLFNFETQKGRYIFGVILSVVIGLISGAGIVCGAIFHIIALVIIGCLIFGYALAFAIWLLVYEIPKYTEYVDYYSIWFESATHKFGASYLGKLIFPEDEGK